MLWRFVVSSEKEVCTLDVPIGNTGITRRQWIAACDALIEQEKRKAFWASVGYVLLQAAIVVVGSASLAVAVYFLLSAVVLAERAQ